MNTSRLLQLAEHLEAHYGHAKFFFAYYRNMESPNTLLKPIEMFNLTHDEAEALFVSGVGRVDAKADGSQMILEMLSPSATRYEVAARIRKFVEWERSAA